MLKIILRFLLLIEVMLFFIGYYIKSSNPKQGNFIVGIAVLGMAFVLLPFFLYMRYKKKKLSEYMFPKDLPKSNNSSKEN